MAQPYFPEQKFPLNLFNTSGSPLRVGAALGETAILFDFGQPIEVDRLRPSMSQTPSRTESAGNDGQRDVVWPIFVLLGNGEVYRLLTLTNCGL